MTKQINPFWVEYRDLTNDEKKLIDDIKEAAGTLMELYQKTKRSRYQSLGITALEESVMWVVKGVNTSEPDSNE